MPMEIKTLHSFDTQYSADTVEWCQTENYKNFFAVGTYQLEEKDADVSANNVRKGRIYLFDYNQTSDELTNCQQIETDAILDQKWVENNHTSPQLWTATSQGNIQRYQMNENNLLEISQEINLNPSENGILALSIDVDARSSRLLASDSKGKISLLDMETSEITKQWKAHGFEAWTCAFNRFDDNIVFSGGDDSVLNVWDLRSDSETIKMKSTKRDAGVTSLLSYKDNILMVGSYDETLKVIDLRNLKNSLDEIHLSGGIWRIKPALEGLLLAACMYHAFSIVDCNKELKLLGEYFEHESICYGCDWSPTNSEGSKIFASCSFYDHKLCIAKIKV